MTKIDCNALPGEWLRKICEGTSGLPPELEEEYRKLWKRFPFPELGKPHDFSCVHRGEVIRETECELCGGRLGMVHVHACTIHGECSVHSHGIRATGPASPKIAVCIACDNRQATTEQSSLESAQPLPSSAAAPQ